MKIYRVEFEFGILKFQLTDWPTIPTITKHSCTRPFQP